MAAPYQTFQILSLIYTYFSVNTRPAVTLDSGEPVSSPRGGEGVLDQVKIPKIHTMCRAKDKQMRAVLF